MPLCVCALKRTTVCASGALALRWWTEPTLPSTNTCSRRHKLNHSPTSRFRSPSAAFVAQGHRRCNANPLPNDGKVLDLFPWASPSFNFLGYFLLPFLKEMCVLWSPLASLWSTSRRFQWGHVYICTHTCLCSSPLTYGCLAIYLSLCERLQVQVSLAEEAALLPNGRSLSVDTLQNAPFSCLKIGSEEG